MILLNTLHRIYREFLTIPDLLLNKFVDSHSSVLKRKRMRDEKLKDKYPEVRSDFYLDIYDKSIINDI